MQISNVKSMKYNCQTTQKKKAPYPSTFSKSSKRTQTFAIFLSVLLCVIPLSNTTHKYYQSLHA